MSNPDAPPLGLTHHEWRVMRRQSDGTWATIPVCLDPRKANDVVRRSHDILPARSVRVQVRSVIVYHGPWKDAA